MSKQGNARYREILDESEWNTPHEILADALADAGCADESAMHRAIALVPSGFRRPRFFTRASLAIWYNGIAGTDKHFVKCICK